jgi:chondroitin 4-sulfotransferase 11
MISMKYRFIFVHVGRTGGSSFERIAGIEPTLDIRTAHLGNTDFEEKHKKFEYYKENYPAEFNTFFKFTFVRNPFDRLVSAWKWQTVIVKVSKAASLKEFIEERPESSSFSEIFKLKGFTIYDSINQFDFIGRFENLAQDYEFLCERLKIKNINIPHTNKTSFGAYQNYYDDDTIELVRNKFKLDLELFGYDFDCPIPKSFDITSKYRCE